MNSITLPLARLRSVAAVALALLIGVGGTITAVPASAADVTPSVIVTPSTDVDPSVENTFTITGTGFVGAGAANGVYVNVGASSVWQPGTVPGTGGFIKSDWVDPSELIDGAFTTTQTAPAGSMDAAGSYGAATFAAHGLSITDRTLDTWTPIALKAAEPEPEPEPEAPTITVSKTTDITPAGELVTVTGTGFLPAGNATNGTRPPLAGKFSGAYVMFGKFADVWQPSASAPTSTRVGAATYWAVNAADVPTVGGASSGAIPIDADGSFSVQVLVKPGFTNEPATGNYGIYTYAAGGAVHAPFETYTPVTFAGPPETVPGTVPLEVAAPQAPVVGAGSLTWGIKQSFRAYVAGPIAHGSITTNGVGTSGGAFVFSQSAGGNASYSGSVRFLGHDGLLDVTIANPVVDVESATLYVSVNGGGSTPFATLDLAAGIRTTPNGTVSYSGVPAALTSQGADVFSLSGSNFYAPGTALDPVSFVIGSAGAAPAGVTTVASFVMPGEPAATPPATSGITVTSGLPVAGGEVTVTASGFEAGETGILVVIYSDPVVLDRNATADANGVVTWTGRLPANLTGTHTLTLQGSVDRGIVLDISPRIATAAAGCPVTASSLVWGFKESFRSYISGSIANGEWTVANGATYATPDFSWADGVGSYDPEGGLVAFAGGITFTGHAGVLNTTVANPQLKFIDADTAMLLLDISGTTQDGTPIDQKSVEFVELDLSNAVASDAGLTVTAAPAVLTAAGAEAFGTYPAGEEFDPFSFTLGYEGCGPIDDAVVTTDAPVSEVSSDAPNLTWLWIVVAVLLLAAAAAVLLVMRRRRA